MAKFLTQIEEKIMICLNFSCCFFEQKKRCLFFVFLLKRPKNTNPTYKPPITTCWPPIPKKILRRKHDLNLWIRLWILGFLSRDGHVFEHLFKTQVLTHVCYVIYNKKQPDLLKFRSLSVKYGWKWATRKIRVAEKASKYIPKIQGFYGCFVLFVTWCTNNIKIPFVLLHFLI